MKRFRFRLESVLKWRLLQLELEEEKLQEQFTELRGLEQRQETLAAGKAEAERAVLGAKTVEAGELAALDAHRRWVAAQRERLARAVLECQKRIEEQRGRVRKAEQNLKLLEKLRQRRLVEWTAAVEKEYQALAEEAYLGQWQRSG
jgi:flagellar FliJ protein